MSKHHIITGGASGIGYAIAKRLTPEEGHKVSLLARNRERLSNAVLSLTRKTRVSSRIPL